MALTSAAVRVAVTGGVYIAPTATAAPTNATTALNAAFVELGYVGEDGVTESRERSIETIKAWQNAATLREVVTDATIRYSFTLLETSIATLTAVYGAAPATGTLDISPAVTGGRKSFVIQVVDGANLLRIYIPQGEVTEVGDVVYASGEPVGYEVTVTAYDTGTYSVRKFYDPLT